MKPTISDAEYRSQVRQRFLNVDSSNVMDALDMVGRPNQALHADFAPYPMDGGKVAGFAYTIRGQMTPYEGTGDPEKMRACSGISSNEVSVWSGDGQGICYFGELIALGMKERGCVGAIVDGGIRDVSWLGMHQFPIFARYRTPVQSIGRWKVTANQIPIYVRGATTDFVTINPGDFVLGDADGVVVVPIDCLEDVLCQAETLTQKEVLIREELAKGLSLAEALSKYGHV
ncbi:RraA family protein [Mesorhizobium sp. ES1-4]|uniref:RraA family protein n=1 Tax=Mesorhizobium sp. ES1-4 TaxID=2876627 RepID=UPI001CCF76A6|nr:RraA family protein [Mesorhizobium sp. ES1-4]MBZ9798437.1 RraA family protein [Mesorhizobium sp. ES1-4]